MNIVVLDAYTLNPGDLSWAELEALGPCALYDRTPPESRVERASGSQIVLTNKTVLSRQVIEQLPKLRYIGVLATGYNVVDTVAVREGATCRSATCPPMVRLRWPKWFCAPVESHATRGRPCPLGAGRRLDTMPRLLLLEASIGGAGRADDGPDRLRPDRPDRGHDCAVVRHERLGPRRHGADRRTRGRSI